MGAPTAFHPPLFPLVLAAGSELGLDSFRQHQAIGCLLGALTVGAVGLIARRLAGEVVGLAAAGMAAIYLPLIGDSSTLFSEALYGLTIAGVLLAALRVLERPTVARAAVLGVAVALAALTRGEGLALILLALPLCRRGGPGTGARVAATLGACAIVDRALGDPLERGDGPAGAALDERRLGARGGQLPVDVPSRARCRAPGI